VTSFNGTVWTSGDALSADIVDGNDPVIGGANFGFVSVMFKQDSIYTLTPIPAPLFYEFDPRVIGVGAQATGTIKRIPGFGIALLGRENVYVYDTISLQPIIGNRGESLRKHIFANMSASNIAASFALLDQRGHRYILFVPAVGWTAAAPLWNVYVINWEYRTWTMYDFSDIPGGVSGGGGGEHTYAVSRTFAQSTYGFNASPYRFNDQSGGQAAPAIIVGGVTSGKVYRLPTTPQYTDDGNAYRSYVQTGLSDLGAPWPIRKQVNRVHILFVPQTAGTLQVSLIKSEDGATQIIVAGQAPEQNFVPLSVGAWFGQTATHFGFQIDDALGTNYWEAKSAMLEVEPGGEK